ncbi:hypothetical protein GRI62_08160 [Erythrobacter arachoides]|uniref:SH3 domain-containing protein n=1 Tax=Aurantiacibacter arachoides TaxID=1850444 RepID=A0A845A7Q6_9SPHN|nr:hypothetical protein [Aurantiacibacter arachoides]MXO93579.1 hypothetical protein [Aurantiacibacter arachoides]GGD48300.1 hypothetical protein GCM10011411_05030 [Aurantiacibacter arachoides]
MTRLGLAAIMVALPVMLVACDRSDPPVEKLERAAEEIVAEGEAEPLPRQAQGPFAPRDECTDQPGGSAFLAELRSAVAARDAQAFAALAADDVQLDFGGGSGRDLLVERLDDPSYDLWTEAAEVLRLGCASDGATLTMPWYFAQQSTVDPYNGAIVTGENVAIHSQPNEETPRVGIVSWTEVERTGNARPGEEWAEITWKDDESGEQRTGFIRQKNLRSIIDYRIGAARRNGRWRVTTFIAGD